MRRLRRRGRGDGVLREVVLTRRSFLLSRFSAHACVFSFESYALCARAPLAIRQAKSQLLADAPETALLVSASREEDLVDYANEDSSFMFNFGSGACATVLEANPDDDRIRAVVRKSAALTDGSFSEDVVMPAGGSRNPPSHATVEAGLHALGVPDPEGVKERLGEVSLANFESVADDALSRSGYDREDLDFVALTHVKRSFHELLTDRLTRRTTTSTSTATSRASTGFSRSTRASNGDS